MKNAFLLEMQARGYLNQCTDLDELDKICSKQTISAYIGFDCTANSLHVGSLLQIMILRLMQKYGHQPIVLLGGGTTLIGDPSGKDSTRKVLNQSNIEENILYIKKIFEKLLDFNNKDTKPIFVNNNDWLSKLNYIDFLREVGSHFTINKMLTFDSVKLRLEREQSLSYMEFNYMILQAYDFYQLYKNKNCILQLGGSDQWGNIVNGVELVRRMLKKNVYGLTTPLITVSSGAKMGKTEKGAIWLDGNLFSPYDYWQFWRNTHDNDVANFLRYFTDLEVKEVNDLVKKEKNINTLKILLANHATKILHGVKAAEDSEATAKETFELGGTGKNLPEFHVKESDLKKGISFLDIIATYKIMNSKSDVRRAIKEKSLKINDQIVLDDKRTLQIDDFNNGIVKVSYGKKKHYLLKKI